MAGGHRHQLRTSACGRAGGPFPFGNNVGYDLHTTQNGLYSPYDAKIIGDYTGLTPPFDFDDDADDY